MTYRVIGSDGAYVIQRCDEPPSVMKTYTGLYWLTVSKAYTSESEAVADMHKSVEEKRAAKKALASACIIIAEETV